MPAPLLRKKPSIKVPVYDPVSAAAWSAGATATAAVLALIDLLRISPAYHHEATPLYAQIEAATALSPCAIKSEARTQPAHVWSFQDYLLTVKVCEVLRDIVVDAVDFVPAGSFGLFDSTREAAAKAIVKFIEQIEVYTKLVGRERAMERLSGNKSLRRGL